VRPVRTNRLIGLPPRPEDFRDFQLLYQNPLVMRYLGGSRDDSFCRRLLSVHILHSKVYGFGIWVFREKIGGRFVGICALFWIRYLGVPEISFGYMLMPQYWHQGLAIEMGRAVLGIGFGQYRMRSVIADIHHHNSASRRVAARLGFLFEANATMASQSQPAMLYRATRHS
jgi:ribosomal-protein-alanine N-acetyltransferase